MTKDTLRIFEEEPQNFYKKKSRRHQTKFLRVFISYQFYLILLLTSIQVQERHEYFEGIFLDLGQVD